MSYMSLMALRFRHLVVQLRLLDSLYSNLNLETAASLIQENLSFLWAKAIAERLDLNTPDTYWDLLGIDAVLWIEDSVGKFHRTAVSLHHREYQAYNALSKARKENFLKVREALSIERYWAVWIEGKELPSKEDWIETIYSEIDLSPTASGCKLITL